ncbi:hypothetical protein HK57_00685 [Aspergillus ustus]|uniref:C2H2-type domain-containing protein n=1 Tax=Aspergillus ustus TaxID=40382 RepID=A0A0C1BVH6_ASPUT|nr:hypothetical protein HK57_00685 [Aspergillus ustus]
MSTFENPLYSLPSSPFADALWTSWAVDGSLGTAQDEGDFKPDTNWQLSMYSIPDYSLPFDNWSDQCPTPLSSLSPPDRTGSRGQLTDTSPDITNWVPNLDALGNSATSTVAIPSPCARDLASQSNFLQDHSTQQPCTLLTSNHSSPSETGSSAPSIPPSTKANRNSKTPIRCWEHSCGGRAFSSLGNYERHLREKSGRAKSFTCEQCGQRFTRSTAKNKHIRYGRCRMRHIQ